MTRPPLPTAATRLRFKSSHRRICLKTSHRRLGEGAGENLGANDEKPPAFTRRLHFDARFDALFRP